MTKSIFLFHRDLRVPDNTTLIRCLRESDTVIPVFIFPPEQIDKTQNKYFSDSAVQFMCESLVDLNAQLSEYGSKLHMYRGDTVSTLRQLCENFGIQAIYSNADYTKYATERDNKIKAFSESMKLNFVTEEDYGLFPSTEGLVDTDGTKHPYTVLAQYYKRYLKDLDVRKPNIRVDHTKFGTVQSMRIHGHLSIDDIHQFYEPSNTIPFHGGRKEALQRLRKIKEHKQYKDRRDYPADEKGTTKLSPHLKFGTISVREMYWECVRAFGTKDHPLIRELVFRDFYARIYAFHSQLQRGKAYMSDIDNNIPWKYNKQTFNAWTDGLTGFPMVDAGMRQLSKIHWMHNRVRMLVASVLTKYFLIDWRMGEKYFAQQLVDYDPISNVAGWGFASSTGVDAVPYFRAPFNPFIQSKKFDAEAEYIKKYVPELTNVAPKDIHKWFDPKVRAKYPDVKYPAPIIDHVQASKNALALWKHAAK